MTKKYRDVLYEAAVDFRADRINMYQMREIIDEVLQVYIEAEDALKAELNHYMVNDRDGGFISGISSPVDRRR